MAKAHEDVTATIAAFRPETATPDDVERLIDVRISQIDAQIKTHLTAAEELKTERKRWISVTGGRSKLQEELAPGPPNGMPEVPGR